MPKAGELGGDPCWQIGSFLALFFSFFLETCDKGFEESQRKRVIFEAAGVSSS